MYNLITWYVHASSLRERAAVALMTGCGASRTTYRIGSEWRQEDPSGSSFRLRAREGQYGEIKRRDARAVKRATDLQELIGRRHASLCLHAWAGCRLLTCLHGIVIPPASRLRLSCPANKHLERGKAITSPGAIPGRPTVRQAYGGMELRGRKKQRLSCSGADRA
jgi:hypothetical protein